VNCSAVAKALNRPPAYVAKHFGFEMGAQVNMDHDNDRYIVNGAHDAKMLQDKLDIFIKNWVLCTNCCNPETKLTVIGGKTIHSYCKACGQKNELKVPGRMAQYITKNSPDKFKVAEIYEDQAKSDEVPKSSPKHHPSPQYDGWGEDADFKLSTDDNALIDRYLEDITGQMGQLTVGAEMVDKLPETEKVDFFVRHLKKIKKKHDDFPANGGADVGALARKLNMNEYGIWAYCDAYQKWTQAEKMSPEKLRKYFDNYKTHLEELCKDCETSQRMMLGVVETIVYAHKKKLLAHTAHILKQLYDDDVVEEDAILKWADKPTKKFVKKNFVEKMHADDNVVKFITWLKENDSSDESSGAESSEEESEEEEPPKAEKTTEESVVSKVSEAEQGSGDVSNSSAQKNANAVVDLEEEEDDEDIDLDAI